MTSIDLLTLLSCTKIFQSN